MDGSSFPDIVTTRQDEASPFGGILVALVLSAALWAIIAALIWWLLRA